MVENRNDISPWIADLAGEVRLGQRQRPDGGTEILRVEGGKPGAPLYACDFGETCSVVRFHRDGKHVYLQSNRGANDLIRLLLVDVATGVRLGPLAQHPEVVTHVALDGPWIVAGCANGSAYKSDVPNALHGEAGHLMQWLVCLTGRTFSETGVVHELDSVSLLQLRARLREQGPAPFPAVAP